MIDSENVIENLEQNIRWIEEIECHQFPGWGNVTMAMMDAVELLKEQEAVKPRLVDGKRNHFVKCGNCNFDLMHGMNFCPHCGRSVKWG